ncbi:MAG: hypothetical protein GY828_07370 [Candidatus Gracilibacteria bacterium]|nr:hypothetical protein [Candidatus Gracilibacteria bacterium]
MQFVLSISSFLSASVLLIPYDTFKNGNNDKLELLLSEKVCTTFVIANKNSPEGNSESYKQGCAINLETAKKGDKGMKTVGEILSSNSAYGLLGVYTYGIFSIEEVTKISSPDIETFTDIFKLTINSLLILVLFIVYMILLISLTLALFVRGVWLWLYTIFSPVFGLLYFFGKEKEGFIDGKFSITEFIGLAMVPVYVSAALAFGLLFTFVAGLSFHDDANKGSMLFHAEPVDATYKEEGLKSISGSGTKIIFANDFEIDMYGSIGTSSKSSLDVLDVMKTGIGTLIMQLFGIAVLWIAVMAALSQSKITEAVVKPIADFGKQVGGLVAKGPQYLPVFGGQSMSSLKTAGGAVSSSLQTTQNTRGNKFAEKHFGGVMGGDKEKEYRNIGATTPGQDIDKAYTNIANLNKVGSSQDIANSKSARDAYVMNLQKINNMRGFSNKKEAEKYIDMIKNANGSKADIDEALTSLDGLASSVNKSILGGVAKVAKGNADEHLGATASGYTSTSDEIFIAKAVGAKNGDNQTYSILNTNIDVNLKENKIENAEKTYEKLALSMQKQGVIGSLSKEDLDNEFKTNMEISNTEDIYKGIAKYLEKDANGVIIFNQKGKGNLISEDLFPENK